jgi:hypothetical protein
MWTIPVRGAEAVDQNVLDTVEQAFGRCHTLADLMRWTVDRAPRTQIRHIVTQDEYTHDVILPFGPYFLSFDTN